MSIEELQSNASAACNAPYSEYSILSAHNYIKSYSTTDSDITALIATGSILALLGQTTWNIKEINLYINAATNAAASASQSSAMSALSAVKVARDCIKHKSEAASSSAALAAFYGSFSAGAYNGVKTAYQTAGIKKSFICAAGYIFLSIYIKITTIETKPSNVINTDPVFVFSITNNTTYPIIIGESSAKTPSDNTIKNGDTYTYLYGPFTGASASTQITIPTPETYTPNSQIIPTFTYDKSWAFDLGWQPNTQYVGVKAVFTGSFVKPDGTPAPDIIVNIESSNWNIFTDYTDTLIGVKATIIFEQLIQPVTPPSQITPFPNSFFAPYVDIVSSFNKGMLPIDISTVSQATGCKYYTLAFMNYAQDGTQSWGGYPSIINGVIQPLSIEYMPAYYINAINTIRNNGGDVIISFGGENASDIVNYYINSGVDSDPDGTLTCAAYQRVIDKYTLSIIDFDIEGNYATNKQVYQKRNKVLIQLRNNPKYKNIKIHFTLATLPSGLTEALAILQDAANQGLSIDVVNIMAMDYGSNTSYDMFTCACNAASNTYAQIQSIGGSLINTTIGITPMIGANDGDGCNVIEIFTLQNAQDLVNYAKSNPYISLLGFWSLNRDVSGVRPPASTPCNYQAICPDKNVSSCVTQSQFQFTKIFNTYNPSDPYAY